MPANGFLQVHAYTSLAQLPLKDTAIAVIDQDKNAIALRLTNSSGQLDQPVAITVPDLSESQSPHSGNVPFASVTLYAHAPQYELIEVQNIQIFADTQTDQELAMIPLSELPNPENQIEIFDTPSQNL